MIVTNSILLLMHQTGRSDMPDEAFLDSFRKRYASWPKRKIQRDEKCKLCTFQALLQQKLAEAQSKKEEERWAGQLCNVVHPPGLLECKLNQHQTRSSRCDSNVNMG